MNEQRKLVVYSFAIQSITAARWVEPSLRDAVLRNAPYREIL